MSRRSRTSRLVGAALAAAASLSTVLVAAPAAPAADTCATKPRPAGKVLQGYWENWDGASNGVHPPFGWTPITNPEMAQHGYNVINAAFR